MSARAHQWRAIVIYRLDEEQAALSMLPLRDGTRGVRGMFRGEPSPGGEVRLTADMVVEHNIVCFACETVYEEARGKPCPGEPSGYGADGTPVWT